MKDKRTIGLWLPPRKELDRSITLENPAHVDARIYRMFCDHLDKKGIHYIEHLDFRKAIIKNHKVYLDGFCLSDLDHFVWMGMLDRSRDSYHLEVMRVLELSTKVHNSHSFYSVSTDKFLAFSILHKYGIPVPELFLVNPSNFQYLKPLFEKDAWLLKPRRSAFGQGIIKIEQYTQLRDIIEYHQNKAYYLEKFYPNDLNEWTGVTVFNGSVLYGFRKEGSKISGWKIYDKDSLGGQTIYIKPNKEIESIAIRIGDILGGNFYGLDFIKTNEGYKVVDINMSPGMYFDFVQELKIPIADHFFAMLEES